MRWLLVCLVAGAWSAQTTFRSDVRLVNLAVSVRDASRRMVDDLSQDDFDVVEDGVPQKIAFFAHSKDVPLHLGLVVDISGSQAAFLKAHQHDLKAFLEKALSRRDRAFLECFGSTPRLVVDYTGSARQLVDALDGYVHGANSRAYPLLGPPEVRARAGGGTSFYDAISHAANQMFQNVDRGRKALIVFSDGEDNDSAHHMMDTIELAQTNDVRLFCIRYTETWNGRWTTKNKQGRGVMERMALETGGADFDAGEKELSTHFGEIGEQLRSSYESAYHSTTPPEDRTFHKVAVRVKRPGLTARSKTGYYARYDRLARRRDLARGAAAARRAGDRGFRRLLRSDRGPLAGQSPGATGDAAAIACRTVGRS
jgi:Ca-activated chloride channel family protein